MSGETTPGTLLAASVTDLTETAQSFAIVTEIDYRRAGECLRAIKVLRTKIAETFDPHISRAFNAHRALLIEKRSADAAAAKADEVLRVRMLSWEEAREREQAARQLTIDTVVAEEAAAVQLAAAEAEATGNYAAADNLRALVPAMPAPLLAPATPAVEGISSAETWSARVTDLGKLVAAAAANPQFVAFLKADMPRLNAQAKALRGRMNIPGVQAVSARTLRVSAAGSHSGPTGDVL